MSMKIASVAQYSFLNPQCNFQKNNDTQNNEVKNSFEFPSYAYFNANSYGSFFSTSFCSNNSKYSISTLEKPKFETLNCDYSNLDEFCEFFSQKINSQLQAPSYFSVRKLIQKLKRQTGAEEKLIKEVLYQTSLYCGYDAIEELSYIIQKENASGFGLLPRFNWGYYDYSSNASLDYLLFAKKMKSSLEQEDSDKSLIVLDYNFISNLEMLKSEHSKYYDEFIKKAKAGDVTVLNLKGWDIKCSDGKYRGANFMLGSGFLYEISKSVIERMQKGENLEDILYKDLEDDFKQIAGDDIEIKRKSPLRERVVGFKTTRDILSNIERPQISKEKLKNVIKKYSKILGEEDEKELRIALCKYLDEFSIVYSPETFCLELIKMNDEINSKFKNNEAPLYYIPIHFKSYGHIMNLYSRLNDVGCENIFGCNTDNIAELKEDLKNNRLVILDDVSASSKSLFTNLKFIHSGDCEDIKITSGVVLMSEYAKTTLDALLKLENQDNEIIYLNEAKDVNYGKKDEEFNLLNSKEISLLRKNLYTGFGGVGLSCAFPHIIPDNSSDISGIIFDSLLYKSTHNSNKAVNSPPSERIEEVLKKINED